MTHKKKEAEKPKSNNRKYLLMAGALMLLTYVVFIPALDNDWTNWDDPKYILDNHIIKDLSWERTEAIFKDEERKSGLYAPLTYLSWAVEHHEYLLDATKYHRDNVILHVMNTGLVFLLILLLVGRYEAAIITALLFGIHPMHVESVAWITERKDVLYTFFYLIALCLYIMYCSREKGKRIWYIATISVFGLSLLSKPAAVTLPLILLLIDFFLGRLFIEKSGKEEKAGTLAQMKLNMPVLLEKAPFFLGSLAWGYITINTVRSIAEEGTFSVLERMQFGFYGIYHYVTKVVAPINLSCFYPFPTLESDGSLPLIFYLAPFFALTLGVLALRSLRITRTVLFGALFFLFTIGLTLQFFPVGPNIVTDRYSYVPYIGLFFIIAQGYVWLIDRQEKKYGLLKMLGTLGLVGFAVWCIYLSRQRCDVWTNSETLWTDVIAKFPNTSEGYLNRGQYYTENDQFDKAMLDYDATLRLNPKSSLAYINRGNVYGRSGTYDLALANYSKAIELSPNDSKIFLNRGNVYGLQGDIPASIVDFTTAIELERNYLDAYINRGISYSKLREFDKALLDFNAALQLNPSSFKTVGMRAYAFLDMGRYDEAIADYNFLLQVNASDGNAYYYRALAKQRKSNFQGAIADYAFALQYTPANTGVYLNRALCYQSLQNYTKALQDALMAQKAGQQLPVNFIANLQAQMGN
ncbi:MAG: tetratricopeptide repeat protein [Flavobacteriales bacterium]|nr:tetratricopeptide repeat protein [Flavobacteriales bacterium]